MHVGDILEWLAAAALAAGGYLATSRVWVALVVLGACLFYFAQGYATTPLRRPKAEQRRRHS